MQQITILLIRFYQFLQPSINQILIAVFGFSFACPSKPTCSQYTILQIRQHGTMLGLYKGLRRIFACRGK